MIEILLFVLIALVLLNILLVFTKKSNSDFKNQFKEIEKAIIQFDSTLYRTEKMIGDEFQRNRTENNEQSKTNREELFNNLKSFETNFTDNIKQLNELLRQKFLDFAHQQTEIHSRRQHQTIG